MFQRNSSDFRDLVLVHGFYLMLFEVDSQGIGSPCAVIHRWRVFGAGLASVASQTLEASGAKYARTGHGWINLLNFILAGNVD